MNNDSNTLKNPSSRALFGLAVFVGILLVIIPTIWSFHTSWPVAMNVFLVAGASLFAGGIIGFLFGIPRMLQGQASAAQQPGANNGQVGGRSYEPNTNLERITEWLTTMIIGISLTQLPAIARHFRRLADLVSTSMKGEVVGAGSILVVFSVSGFLMVYLWTRSYLSISDAMREIKLKELIRLERQYAREDYVRQPQATTLPVPDDAGLAQMRIPMSMGNWERTPGTALDDPWKGVFGGSPERNNRKLSATVEDPTGSEFYKVTITVTSTDSQYPLAGQVRLFLHDSFAPYDKLFVQVENGVAEYEIRSYGAFTVGALADNGVTELELDLSQLPKAPRNFRLL